MEDINEVWNDCYDYVSRLCDIRLKSFPDAKEDVLSEVYIAFSEAVKNGKEIEYPKSFLYKTANNQITKKFNELIKEREKNIYTDFISEEVFILQITPDITDLIISDEDIDNMADEIIASCTEEEQKILQMFHKEGKSFNEIAEILGKTGSSVKQQNYRLCKKIRRRVVEILGE